MHIVEYVREAYAFLYKQWLVSINAWYEEPKRAPPEQPVLALTYHPISDEAHYEDEFTSAGLSASADA